MLLFIAGFHLILNGQSPHGTTLSIDCAVCHNSESWNFDTQKASFSHDSTTFELKGQHSSVECRSCHTSMVFSDARQDCYACHTDIHQQTVGTDCARCHNSDSWIVENITEIHERISFPLMGVHAIMDCNACHLSETNVRFSPTGVTCIDCHRADFTSTKSPDHVKNNFSEDCSSCHSLNGNQWSTDIIDHSFFPLVQGHDIKDCNACHTTGNYSDVSADCFSCHQTDFQNTSNPNHQTSQLSTSCSECHTLSPGWKPANFQSHDGQYFPIYSGKHKGKWTECKDCHIQENNFAAFSCVVCHQNPETNVAHNQVSGYVYEDNACLACHPTGDADMAFNHDETQFPLTGAHKMVDCNSCHANGYIGTPTACAACHITDFNQTSNPKHNGTAFSTDCVQCHTTASGWSPATFPDHNLFYVFNGAHIQIANDCAACHQGSYNNTPNTCIGCHSSDFNGAKNPDHALNQFSTDCTTCHSENAWIPSNFNHDGMYFPIFTGKHAGQWTECMDCHKVSGDFTQFTCISCHTNPETDNEHQGVGGYTYNDQACLACHPTGDADFVFDHNMTTFPLTGAHTTTDCIQCHAQGFQGTSTVCMDCHLPDYQQSVNPNHTALAIPTDCAQCHSTQAGWEPASFPIHNSYYSLNGAHAVISNDCVLCHNGDYNNTPNTCYGCHNSDYTSTTNPNHQQLLFPQDCAQCHTETAWSPSTFNHDGMYFPIYSGKHKGEWSQCSDCHNTPGNWSQFTCITCHQNPETNHEHEGVPGYIYNSDACLACHPTGDSDFIFDHNSTAFPLTGGHINIDCNACHVSGFQSISSQCVDCHLDQFNQSLNPNHNQLGLPMDCAQCHTTTPGWAPASFGVHNNYYALNGAHASISNDCALCYNGNYNNTPQTCNGCHNSDYTSTSNPNHILLQFPTDCAQCHNESAWVPSTFNHDGQYFPIYSGSHNGVWSQCQECHNNPSNYSQFTCITCHQNPETNNEHDGVPGYFYDSNACLACHPTGESDFIFDHNSTAFPLTGAHATTDCIQCHATGFQNTSSVCLDCHTQDFNQSTNPNHVALNIPMDCVQCHTTAPGWSPATFAIHNNYYVLEGAHVGIANECATCHNGDYNNTPNTCVGCHQNDYSNTTNPDHAGQMFSTDCSTCHSQNSWTPSSFNHDIFWPLTGAHSGIADNCVACHNGNYNNTSSECVSCHQQDYNNSTNPNHSTLNLGNNCSSCHTTQPGWSPATFAVHNDFYVLAGAHTTLDCASCHNGNYNNTPNTCVGCHQSDYNDTTDPDHEAALLPTDCTICHSQTAWSPSTFDHNTIYPLLGAHATIANNCIQCHIAGNYTSTPNTCVGCHQSDYNDTTDPDHEAALLPTDCTMCHSQSAWSPSTFDHNTIYPLLGAHASIANNCVQCHIAGNYTSTPNTCVGCHQSDYNSTLNPNHNTIGISTDCAACHTNGPGWSPALFPEHDSYYAIQGAHTSLDCVNCHNGDYNNTPNTCVGCHQSDYNGTTNPNHANLMFPTDCETCHTQTAWIPSTFDHDGMYFPIYSGKHEDEWNTCSDCHTIAGNYGSFSCINCHEHNNQADVNDDHDGVSGYQYNSNACYSCHPTGEE